MDEFEQLKRSLTNHSPTQEQIDKIEVVRAYAYDFAQSIVDKVPQGREKSLAKTHLEEAVMWAVKGIILEQK